MSNQSEPKDALYELEQNLIALESLLSPRNLPEPSEYFQAHRELVNEMKNSLLKIRTQHANELANACNTAGGFWYERRTQPRENPRLAREADTIGLRFSDYRYEDSLPTGEARFSDYRYSPEQAGDRFSDYQVIDHDFNSQWETNSNYNATLSRSPNFAPELQTVQDNETQGHKESDFQQYPGTPALPRDSDPPTLEYFKSFRVGIEDPCYKVLPAALIKYKIQADWRLYDLYIVYGAWERCVALDEKPLALFKEIDRQGKKPMFMLRKARIAVAEGRGAKVIDAGSDDKSSASGAANTVPSRGYSPGGSI